MVDVADDDTSRSPASPARRAAATAASAADGSPKLVINEVDYDQVGADHDEFVEIYNAGDGGRRPHGRRRLAGQRRRRRRVQPQGAHGHARRRRIPRRRRDAPERRAGRRRARQPDDEDADRRALVRGRDHGGDDRRYDVRPRRGHSRRRSADSSTVEGSLSRIPNGTDTNNSATDWAFTTTVTRGAANVATGSTACGGRRAAGRRGNLRRPSGVEEAVVGRPLEDAELVERAQRGDLGAYEELVSRYQGIAFRTAYVVAGSAADAEEAAQDGFLKAYRALGRFRPGAPFRPWLLEIVGNEARNRRRSAGRRDAARAARRREEVPRGRGPVPRGDAAGRRGARGTCSTPSNALREDDRLVIAAATSSSCPRRRPRPRSACRAAPSSPGSRARSTGCAPPWRRCRVTEPSSSSQLRALGPAIDFPPTPDLRPRVRDAPRPAPPPAAGGCSWSRSPCSSSRSPACSRFPSARSAILDWLGIGGVKFEFVDQLPARAGDQRARPGREDVAGGRRGSVRRSGSWCRRTTWGRRRCTSATRRAAALVSFLYGTPEHARLIVSELRARPQAVPAEDDRADDDVDDAGEDQRRARLLARGRALRRVRRRGRPVRRHAGPARRPRAAVGQGPVTVPARGPV